MHLLSAICGLALTVYLTVESVRSPAKYRKLKQAIDSGDTLARNTFYYEILWFEWISFALALAALRRAIFPPLPGLSPQSPS